MLAHARVLGYAFNPLTCSGARADGTLACVIAEVHNTYGQRHAYLLRTDDRGRARAEKELYVSPYHPVDGWYQIACRARGRGWRSASPCTARTGTGSSPPSAAPRCPPPGEHCCAPPCGTRGPPSRCPPGSGGRGSSCARAGCGRCRGRHACRTRGFSDQATSDQPHARHRGDRPGPVADVAAARGSAVRGEIARLLFGAAVSWLPVRVRLPAAAPRRRAARRADHDGPQSGRLLRPAGRGRPDRLRRVLLWRATGTART